MFKSITFALLSLVALTATAAEPSCPENAAELPPLFEVRATDNSAQTPAVDATKDGRELNRLSRGLSSRGFLLGLTDATFGTRVLTGKNGCGQRLVVLEIVLTKQTVYVSSNVAPDSCTFRETVEHELHHVELNRKILSTVRTEMSKAFDASRFNDPRALADAVVAELRPKTEARLRAMGSLHYDFDHEDMKAPRSVACRQELAYYSAN